MKCIVWEQKGNFKLRNKIAIANKREHDHLP